MHQLTRGWRHRQAGLSLVELMVGITVGLIVVAAASLLISGQLVENRRLIAETQVQQDLRATADIITRELRRSGSLGPDEQVQTRMWHLGSAEEALPNWFARTLTPAAGANNVVRFSYVPGGPGETVAGGFGFRHVTDRGVIQTNLVAGGWQDLTDPATLNVTAFSVTRVPDVSYRIPCSKPCPGGAGSACWPTVNLRALEVSITARSRAAPEVIRTVQSRVRLRNDFVRFYLAIPPDVGQVCPP